MKSQTPIEATIIIILGAAGDLARRKLIPALYNLYIEKWTPANFAIIGVGHTNITLKEFRKQLRQGVDEFSRQGGSAEKSWQKFETCISHQIGEFNSDATYGKIGQQIKILEKSWQLSANCIFYLAVPPSIFEAVALRLNNSGLVADKQKSRLVIEKPFGEDLQSATDLNKHLHNYFNESQIFRIDHYLGKEAVQNILAFRFANILFEPIWNRNYIDQVQVSVSEKLGVESRGDYYESTGALRDMVQNHLLQLLSLIAMEPPVSFDADEVRNRKVDVLNALRKIQPEEVNQYAVRGQYAAGWTEGKKVAGYTEEAAVAPHSGKETFVALKLFIDNWRWEGVPFYLRTGKRLNEKSSMITIQFKSVPHQFLPPEAAVNCLPNKLIIRIQPQMDIRLHFQAKHPGLKMILQPVDMQFNYATTSKTGVPEAYETLLLDVMEGDSTLFMRADQVEAAWKALMPVIDSWETNPPLNFPNYEAGTTGPEEADALLAKDGHSWISEPSLP